MLRLKVLRKLSIQKFGDVEVGDVVELKRTFDVRLKKSIHLGVQV